MLLKALKHVVLSVVLLPAFLAAQSPLDSLNGVLRNLSITQKEYLETLINITKEYAESEPDTALFLGKKALEVSLAQGNDSIKGQVYITLSTAHSYLASYDSATQYSIKALEVAERFQDTISIIDAYNNLGIDFMFQEDDEKAINYFQKVEALSSLFGDSLRWGHALNNLGMMIGFGGNIREELIYYERAAHIFKGIGENEGYANTLLNSGTSYMTLEQYLKAAELYKQALEIFEDIGYTSGIQNTLQSSAENLMYLGDLQEAEKMANRALEIAEEFQFGQDEIYTYDLLSQIAVRSIDFKKAFEYLQKKSDKKEEVFTAEKSQQIAELETKYQTEKKEQQLALNALEIFQKKRELYYLFIIIAVLILVGCYIIYSLRKQSRLKYQLLSEEIDNLRLKINSLLGNSEGIEFSVDEINEKLHKPLTDREFEILSLTISDKNNKEIANEIFISVNTVKYHLKNIYEKLGVANRKEAVQLIVGQS